MTESARMSLSASTRLGPYEITGTLGAGGMDEVYATNWEQNIAKGER